MTNLAMCLRDYLCRVVNGKRVKLQIWDTAGQERYRSMAPLYYRGAVGVVLVYDTTRESSFGSMASWYDELYSNLGANAVYAVAGNKSDLSNERGLREVSLERGKLFAAEKGAIFKETSAKHNTGIESLFSELASSILKRTVLDGEQDGEVITVGGSSQKKTGPKKCC